MDPALEPSQKQQTIELLRSSNTVLITISKAATIDEIAAALALTQILDKMGKRAEAVVSTSVPSSLEFLPLSLLHKEFRGNRDFVIELDTSRTEADKLKYIPEDKKLKIFITPFNGNFSEADLSFGYGDYHNDLAIALGAASPEAVDPAVANQTELLAKTRLVLVKAGGSAAANGPNTIMWVEPTAISLCEIVMSLTEALQPGLLDSRIATSLLTGIQSATNHFTSSATTPKVMTMAAQLLAAGADQATIVSRLAPAAPAPAPTSAPAPVQPKDDNELAPALEKSLPRRHRHKSKAEIASHKPKHPEPKPAMPMWAPKPEVSLPTSPPPPPPPPPPNPAPARAPVPLTSENDSLEAQGITQSGPGLDDLIKQSNSVSPTPTKAPAPPSPFATYTPPKPPSPPLAAPAGPLPAIRGIRTPLPPNQSVAEEPLSSLAASASEAPTPAPGKPKVPKIDLDAARKAVEDALHPTDDTGGPII